MIKLEVGKKYKAMLFGANEIFKVMKLTDCDSGVSIEFQNEKLNSYFISKIDGYPAFSYNHISGISKEVKAGGVVKGSAWSIDRHIAQINKRLEKQIDINCRAAKNYLHYQVTKMEKNELHRWRTQQLAHFAHVSNYSSGYGFIAVKNNINDLLQQM